MKSMLIVTEQFTMGGLETHIRGEILRLTEMGIQVHLATGRAFDDALLPADLSTVSHGLPLEPTATPEELVTAINQLRKIIREHSIHWIHIHPFTSIIPAATAAELESIPYALTLHGPASLASYAAIYDLLLKDVILPATGLIVAVSPEVQRLVTTHATSDSVALIPNAVAFEEWPAKGSRLSELDPRWLLVSRLDQFKIHGVVDFCVKAKHAGIPGVLVVGDGSATDQLLQRLDEQGLKSYVTLLGASTQVNSLIQKTSGVAGMGRVVLEGVASRKPVALVGYDGVKGIVDDALLALAAEENFSGRGLATIGANEFSEQLHRKATDNSIALAHAFAKASFNDCDTWPYFLKKMSSVPQTKPSALTALYHELSASPIKGTAPYIYSLEVLDRLGTVICGKSYYDPRLNAALSLCKQRIEITSFNEAMAERDSQITSLNQAVTERDGEITRLNQTLAERDGQITSLNQTLAERDGQITGLNRTLVERDDQVATLNRALSEREARVHSLTSSHSWKLSKPLRVASRLVRSLTSEEDRYTLLKAAYWRLPVSLRNRLNRRRHAYVAKRFHRVISNLGTPTIDTSDPSLWVSKANHADRVVIIPCGFEFNELVNQRPINAAKYFAEQGYLVLFVAWQWSPDELVKCGEVWPNVYQVPLFAFTGDANKLQKPRERSIFLLTMPAPALIKWVSPLRQLGFAIVYDIMDEWEAFFRSGQAPWYLRSSEDALVLHADFVCGVSPALRDKFSHLRSDIKVIGNGYDSRVIGDAHRGIAGKAKEGKCIVGYFGHLTDAWFDWDLIFDIARARPDITIEIIGYGEPEWAKRQAATFPNIAIIGKIPPRDLHRFVTRWSAGIIPFIEGDLAEAVDPIKIYEYLYFGLPTLVTGIKHLHTYPMTFCTHRGMAKVAFASVLACNRETDELENFLQQTTWHARFGTLVHHIKANENIRALYAE